MFLLVLSETARTGGFQWIWKVIHLKMIEENLLYSKDN